MPLERRLKLLTPAMDEPEQNAPLQLKVAFASADLRHVDQHFGAAAAFALYAITPTHTKLLEVVQFNDSAVMDGNDNKLTAKIAALHGCALVYCQAIGAAAINQLRAKGLQAMKVAPGTAIKTVLTELQQELRTGPSAWLVRVMTQQGGRPVERFDAMAAEDWSE